MADGIEQWWKELPIVTKYLFALSFGLTIAASQMIMLVNPVQIILDFQRVFYHFEIWRLITCFFYHGKLGFPFLINMIFLVRYGQSLEQTVFFGRTADYVFFLLFGGSLLLVTAFFLKLYILGNSLIMMLIYLWSRKNPNVTMSFMFGVKFQSFYFPWVLVGFNLLMGGFPLAEIVGIVVGHIYFFLTDIYPNTGGSRLINTPQFLYGLFPPPPEFGGRQHQQQQQQGGRHNWGTGYALGGH